MRAIDVLKQSVSAFADDKLTRLASAVSFAAIFSIAPLIIVMVAILSIISGGHHTAAPNEIFGFVGSSAGPGAADQVRLIVDSTFGKSRQTLIAQIVGWVVFVIGASNLFAALQDALNAIFHIEKTRVGWKQIVRDRLAAAGMILIVVVLLGAVFAGNAAAALITGRPSQLTSGGGGKAVIQVVTQLVSLVVETIVFSLVLKVLPDVKIPWRDIWLGGAITAVLFTVGQIAIGIYFVRGGVTNAYGAAGALLVTLLLIYYSTIIILFGAEVTKFAASKVALGVDSTVKTATEQRAGADPRDTQSA